MPQWPQERRKLPHVNLQGSPSKGRGLTEVSQVVFGPQHNQMGHTDVQHCTRAKKGNSSGFADSRSILKNEQN